MNFRVLSLILLIMILSPAVAQEAPVIVNSQTGAQVELVRAYWDPNTDIANRVMQCDFYAFNEESQVYEEQATFAGGVPARPWFRSSSYFHQPLLSLAAPVNDATIGTEPGLDDGGTFIYTNLRLWSVTDGVYAGIAPLMASEYVEIVAHRSDTKNAVRVWHTAESVAYINTSESEAHYEEVKCSYPSIENGLKICCPQSNRRSVSCISTSSQTNSQ